MRPNVKKEEGYDMKRFFWGDMCVWSISDEIGFLQTSTSTGSVVCACTSTRYATNSSGKHQDLGEGEFSWNGLGPNPYCRKCEHMD